MDELDDVLGCEERTARIRAEIDERRRRQLQQTDSLFAQEFILDPLTERVGLPLDNWQIYGQQLMNADMLSQPMFEQQLLQRDQLTRRRRLLQNGGFQSLVNDFLPKSSSDSAAYLMPDGHHTQDFLSRRNRLHQTHQSSSLDIVPYDTYLLPNHSATPPIAPTVIQPTILSSHPMSAMYADAPPYVYANGALNTNSIYLFITITFF